MLSRLQISPNDEHRILDKKVYDTLHSSQEKEFNRITEIARLLCETPVAVIKLTDENEIWSQSNFALDEGSIALANSFCKHTMKGTTLFEIQDTLLDPRFADQIMSNDSTIRFYAGYPLIDGHGNKLGTLCVMDHTARALNESQKRALALLVENIVDLTIEKKKQDEFSSFERMFRLSPHLICIFRPEVPFLKLNPALCKLTGLEDNTFRCENWRDVIHPEDWENVLHAFNTVSADDSEVVITTRTKSASGNYRNIEWVISLEHSIGHLYALGRDITDEQVLNKELQHTTQLLSETNQVARIGSWEIDLDNNKHRWTSVTKQIHAVPDNYEPDIDTAIEFYKDEEVRQQVREAIANGIAFGKPWSLEVQIVDATGKTIWVNSLGKAEMRDGRCHRLYGTFQDIDERKKIQLENENSRAILQAFVQHNPAAVAMLNREMEYIAVSDAWLRDYRLADKNVLGKSYYELFPFITAKGKARHQRILAGAIEQHLEDNTLFDGSEFTGFSAWEMRPWHLIDGSIGGIMIFTQDVTHRIEQRQKLIAAKIEAEAASNAKSEFLANMSHELRTPLNGILGFAQLALHAANEVDRKQFIDLITESGHTLLKVINNILDYSQLKSDKMISVTERTDLHQLIEESIEEMMPDATSKDLALKSHVGVDIQRFIWTDSVRLRQVLRNLLSNALKFTDVGNVLLQVDRLEESNDFVTLRFSVSDTGIGILPENQKSIFEAFTQEDSSLTRKYGGTGLGLTVSNKLLHSMDSTLQLQSSPYVGSTFHFDLRVKGMHH
ncbi:PAS domain-containing sensor histidine kinase [Sphingobacterium chungjuense]|uniref:PAS domain-containing sensor histidine kinase n=1 Tax=Sphingobacterium chungjuense TaxID=2675553 RepID=UPI00140897E7|nr:ATP-binding protein [Sphingobacterium chungjuense]